MDIVRWSPQELQTLNTHVGLTTPAIPNALVDPEAEDPSSSFGDAFAASFSRENLMWELFRHLQMRAPQDEETDSLGAEMSQPASRVVENDPTWNPYAFIRQNWAPEQQAEFEMDIRRGLFEHTKGPDDLAMRVQELRREKDIMNTIAHGSGLAVVLGGLAGGVLDITNLIPIAGVATKGRLLARAATGALTAGGVVGLQELGLHQFQDYRTAKESFLNIGVGALLGAGLGTFAHFINPAHPMNPAHPGNPLRPENFDRQPVGVRNPDGSEDIIAPRSVGAAEAGATAPEQLPGLISKIPGLNWLGEKITGATPAGRALQWTSPQMRSLALQLMDTGGILTNLNRFGVRNAARQSAEDIKRDFMTGWQLLAERGQFYVYKLNQELGQSEFAQRVGLRGTVREERFAEVARRKLLGDWNEADTRSLTSEYGADAASKIESYADRWAEDIHKENARYEEALIDLGKLRDPGKLSKLKSELAAVRRQIAGSKAQETPVPVELRAERARLVEALTEENRKPEAMGRDYGHAQLWDAQAVMSDPYGFEKYLLDVMVKHPDPDWLLTRYGITTEDYKKLGKEDVQKLILDENTDTDVQVIRADDGEKLRREILSEWTGDEYAYRLMRAEAEVNAARDAVKQTENDLADLAVAGRFVDPKVSRLKVSEARKVRDAIHARAQEAVAKREQSDLMRRAFVSAAEAARTKTLDRQLMMTEEISVERILAAEQAVKDAENRLFITVSDSLKDPASKERVAFSGEYAQGVQGIAEAEQRLASLIAVSDRVPDSVQFARAEARARFYEHELVEADRRVRVLAERSARFESKLEEVQAARKQYRAVQEGIDAALVEARLARKIAGRTLREAVRELAQRQRATPLAEAVSDIRQAISNHQTLPHAILDRIAVETGRVKERRIRLTPEQRRLGEQAGYLRTDLPAILHKQYDQLSGYIGLHEALDIRKGGTFESWADVVRSVDEEYERMVGANPDKAGKINAERQRAQGDLTLLKNRLLGTENIGVDRNSWTYWLSQKVLQANFVRYGAGFLLPSLTDAAVVHLRTGSLARLLQKHGSEAVTIMKDFYRDHPSEFIAMVNASELGHQGIRMAQLLDAENGLDMFGIGVRGSTRQRVTSAVDRPMRWLMDKTNVVSGMRLWNRFWKITAGVHRAYFIRDAVAKFDQLPEQQVADLASLGIDRAAAGRIRKMIEQYGQVHENGHWDPRLEEWSATREGREAARDFRIAIEKDMNRAIFTPGIGDRPKLMSHIMGKLWLQFQTFAFTFLNRFMIPASQRIATWQDAQAVVSFAHLAWLGLVVVLGKDIINGRDPSERLKAENWGNTTKEIVDRTGLTTYLSPYIDSALKLSSGTQEALFGDVLVGPTSRYARNGWLESAFGASFGLYRDMAAFGAAASQGDVDQITKKGLQLLPWNTHFRLMNNLYTTLQE